MARAKKSTVQMKDINSHLVCSLCGGYYIDATTIIECLHSFCKTCIVRYLETSKYCPKCDVQVHKTRPLLNIRPDYTLQDLVYKLVPGLLTMINNSRRSRQAAGNLGVVCSADSFQCAADEMKKRRDFYNLRPPSAEEKEDKQTEHERKLLAEEDKMSIALEFSPNGKPLFGRRDKKNKEGENQQPDNTLDCRYLLCPSDFTIGHIKKFIRMKFGLSNELAIDVFHDFEPLDERYTLMDLAYMYLWRKRSPFKLFYSVYQSGIGNKVIRRKLPQTEIYEEPAAKKYAADPQLVEPSTSSQEAARATVTEKPVAVPVTASPETRPSLPANTPTVAEDTKVSEKVQTTAAAVTTVISSPTKTVINKSPLQLKIVTPTEQATSAKTSTVAQQPLTPAKTPSSNGKSPINKLQQQQQQMRPGQAMILPVRLPLSAVLKPATSTTASQMTVNKPLLPKAPITAHHQQLPKQVTRDTELKLSVNHKSSHAQKQPPKLLMPKSPVVSKPPQVQQEERKSPSGQKSQSGQKSPCDQKSPSTPNSSSPNHKSPAGNKSPVDNAHSDPKHKPFDGKITIQKTAILNSPTRPSKDAKQSMPTGSSSSVGLNGNRNKQSSGNSTTVNSLSFNKDSNNVNQAKPEPKVPPLRIPISRTDLSKTDISMHHAPIRRPILQHILPKKPKKKDSNKSKVDLLQAKFGRNPNGQTFYLGRSHHNSKPSTSTVSSPTAHNMMPANRQPLLMPKPAHMNDKPAHLPPPPQAFHNTKHAHVSAPAHNPPATTSHPTEEQDVPLDLQTPKTVKVS